MSTRNPKAVVLHRGFLIKQGGTVKTWKKRFFTLSESELKYVESKSGATKGIIPLQSISKVQMNAEGLMYGSLFEVTTPNRTYLMRAPSPSDAQAWVSAINKALENLRDGSSSSGGTGKGKEIQQVQVQDEDEAEGDSKNDKFKLTDTEYEARLSEIVEKNDPQEVINRLIDEGKSMTAIQIEKLLSNAKSNANVTTLKKQWLVDLYTLIEDDKEKEAYKESVVVLLLGDEFERNMVIDQLNAL